MNVTIDEYRRHRNAQPFRPFKIRLRDGREVRVDSPARTGWNGEWIGVSSPSAFAHFHIADIVEIKTAHARRRAPGDAAQRRRKKSP